MALRQSGIPNVSGFFSFLMRFMVAGLRRRELQWGQPGNTRDVFVAGDCDQSVIRFAELLGWKDDLVSLKQSTDADLVASGKVASSSSQQSHSD
ncbi:unnamed protein product [Echinostoma caproni]|uniref:NAD_binding_4 domain-containing protein n=1 Tax=Echinostoma caproni TaxID=27848 RepID=A0A183ANZ8_9TREM|nr:unnamed protein product [Echinostoma caproni]